MVYGPYQSARNLKAWKVKLDDVSLHNRASRFTALQFTGRLTSMILNHFALRLSSNYLAEPDRSDFMAVVIVASHNALAASVQPSGKPCHRILSR